jgi:hypothetical protein
MENSEIIEILEAAIEHCAKEDGWANLAEVGGNPSREICSLRETV